MVVHADARVLVVRVSALGLRCTVAVAYAPQSGAPEAERESWWADLVELLLKFQDVLLLVDANIQSYPHDSMRQQPGTLWAIRAE